MIIATSEVISTRHETVSGWSTAGGTGMTITKVYSFSKSDLKVRKCDLNSKKVFLYSVTISWSIILNKIIYFFIENLFLLTKKINFEFKIISKLILNTWVKRLVCVEKRSTVLQMDRFRTFNLKFWTSILFLALWNH